MPAPPCPPSQAMMAGRRPAICWPRELGGVPRLKAAGEQPPGRAQPLRGFKRSGQHWGWATEAAWGWKDTDKSWGTKKQHKAINNRSEFRSVRDLGDPTFPGAGHTQHPQLRQTLLQGTACHTHWAEPFISHCPRGRQRTPRHRQMTAHAAKPAVTPEGTVHSCPGPERPVVDCEHLGHRPPQGPGPVTSWPLGQSTKARRHTRPVRSPGSPWTPPPRSPPLAPWPPPALPAPPPPGLSPCAR